MRAVLDACPGFTLVLNRDRQIVYANRAFLNLLNVGSLEPVLGRRPGEAIGCPHALQTSGGCGTSEACQYCGALLSILDALSGKTSSNECRITRQVEGRSEALDLAVFAAPVTAGGEQFLSFSMIDISGEKRRRALERVFFHDVLNTASNVQGLAGLLSQKLSGEAANLADMLRSVSGQLMAEITSQRTLAAAENNELSVDPRPFATLDLVREEACRFRGFAAFGDRRVEIDPVSADAAMVSDRALLGRVLGNMLKNALEASLPGQTVWIGCREAGGQIEFWVRNTAVMPHEVQLQVFQRSFSTKGGGRGLGTYGMRLLTERYLGGSVSFESREGLGTEFRARYPRRLP